MGKYERAKRRERLHLWVAWRVPRWLAYWCAIRVMSAATVGEHRNQVGPDLTCLDALDRWGDTP